MKKQRWEESEKRREEARWSEKRKSQKKEDAGARKGRKVASHTMFFPMFRGSGGSKSRLAKAAGAKPSGEMRDEELHAVVKLRRRKSARRCCCCCCSCPKHVWKSTYTSKDVWKLRCWKSARRCGAKHVSKSKMCKAHHSRSTFGSWDVQKVHAVVARNTFRSQTCLKLKVSDHFWKLGCGFAWQAQGIRHEKWCQSYEVTGPVTQNHLSKPEDLMLQNATLSGNQRTDLLTSLMNMSLVLRLPHEKTTLQVLFKCPTPAIFFGDATKPSRFTCLLRLVF